METLCQIRDLYRMLSEFESDFIRTYGLSLNEGMLLCSLCKTDSLTSGDIAELLGLTPSNASKVIRSVENKGLICRGMGREDRRQMYFSLTEDGHQRLAAIKNGAIEIPEPLKAILQKLS